MKPKSAWREDLDAVFGLWGLQLRQWWRRSTSMQRLEAVVKAATCRGKRTVNRGSARVDEPDGYRLTATVLVLIPEFSQVIVETEEGLQFVITRNTPGVNWQALRVGETLVCTVTHTLPRVLAAELRHTEVANDKTTKSQA